MADVAHDVQSLLSSPERDFLVRNNGDQVLYTSKLFMIMQFSVLFLLLVLFVSKVGNS